MLDHILVAVDGTEAAQPALDHAVALARQSGAALTGLFVIDTEWHDFIGNDWQSARNARQGFLDHVREEQEQQARAAREQFERCAGDLPRTAFALLAGDPAQSLLDTLNCCEGQLLVLGKKVFQVSGRPSLKSLGKRVAAGAQGPVMLFP